MGTTILFRMTTRTTTDTAMAEFTHPNASNSKPERPSTTVEKPTPYTYDLGYLTATDPNPLPSTSTLLSQSYTERNTTLQTIARDGAQSLLAENEWLVEVDDDKAQKESEGTSVRAEGRRERMERIKRQDRRQRNNEKRNKKGKAG